MLGCCSPKTALLLQGPSAPGIGIFAKTCSQPGANGIGGYVHRLRAQAFIAAQGMVVVSRLPDRCIGINLPGDGPPASGLEDLQAAGERSASQFDQPVKMIRHDHPGQGTRPSRPLHRTERLDQKADVGFIVEPASTRVCHRGDRVDVAGLRPAANTECGAGHARRLCCDRQALHQCTTARHVGHFPVVEPSPCSAAFRLRTALCA